MRATGLRVEVRGQPSGTQQAWQQTPLPTARSHQPCLLFLPPARGSPFPTKVHVPPRKKIKSPVLKLPWSLCPTSPTAVRSGRHRLHCFASLNPSAPDWDKGAEYLSPGMSSRLVIPVQLMSSVWKTRAEESGRILGHTVSLLNPHSYLLYPRQPASHLPPPQLPPVPPPLPTPTSPPPVSYRAFDKEHRHGPHDRKVPGERLENHPQDSV